MRQCGNVDSVLGSRCSRYCDHVGPHMAFDHDGTWSVQWVNDADPAPIDADTQWIDWTRAKEKAVVDG